MAACEGPFAPVAVGFEDGLGVIEFANDSDLGLGASVWTADLDRRRRFARAFEEAAVPSTSTSDPPPD